MMFSSCTKHDEEVVLSGLLWGGEGRRLIIEAADDDSFLTDTIIVNHLGEFFWDPDTLIPGFYILSEINKGGLPLLFDGSQKVYLDAQFISFPDQVIIEGSDCSNDLLNVEKISEEWMLKIQDAIYPAIDTIVLESPSSLENLYKQLNSIDSLYRKEILDVSDDPFVKMYALLQVGGNRQLFDAWEHRSLFFEVDSMLKDFHYLREVAIFSQKVKKLREEHNLKAQASPGQIFPELILTDCSGNNFQLSDIEDSVLFLHFLDSLNLESFVNKQLYHNRLRAMSFSGWKACLIMVGDYDPTIYKSDNDYLMACSNMEASGLLRLLGVKEFPVNFILNREGLIVAKNVTDLQLIGLLKEAL